MRLDDVLRDAVIAPLCPRLLRRGKVRFVLRLVDDLADEEVGALRQGDEILRIGGVAADDDHPRVGLQAVRD